MSKERTLANIAQTAYWTVSENQDTFDRVAKAVEKEVLARLKKSEVEPVAGQELTIGQAAKIAEDNGSTDILEYFNDDLSRFVPCGYNNCIYLGSRYRVAPKKINDPDGPTTWAEGTFILVRNSVSLPWLMGTFIKQVAPDMVDVIVGSERLRYLHAKLATADQIEAWKLINGEL